MVNRNTLFWHFPDLSYFVKDRQSRFVAANPAFLEMAGVKSEQALLGKTDYDIWLRFLAEKYVSDDRAVMDTGRPLINKIELIIQSDRSTDWFATTKVPLRDATGEIVGIEGVCRYLKKSGSPVKPVLEMSAVFDFVMEHYSRKIEVPELAAMVSMSVKQLERKFKKEYGTLPMKYINRIRLDAACQLLVKTRMPISKVAMETGFYDSSHFANQFVKSMGISPKEYREKHYDRKIPTLPDLDPSRLPVKDRE